MSYRYSVLMAVYEVEQYLEATLQSLRSQTVGFQRIEVIAVDDGSSDSSLEILRRWARRYPNVKVLAQENAGPGAARAEALRHATGEWVTTIDPDDLVARDYFAAVDEFLSRDAGGHADLLATRVYILDDATGRFRDNHPLGQKFRFGDRIARLVEEPEAFQLGATALMRRDVLARHSLSYDEHLRPTFEDAQLIARYLGTFDDPTIGLVASAHYYYRKRQDLSSLVQSSWSLPERFSVVPRRGYLSVLEGFSARGAVPEWVQYMVLYDVIWYLKEDQAMNSKVGWLDSELREEFTETLDQIMRHIDRAVIEKFACNAHGWSLRQAILVRFATADDIVPPVFRWGDREGHAQLTVLYRGAAPDVQVFVDGVFVEEIGRDFTSHVYFGQEYMVEERLSVPSGSDVAVFVDGVLTTPRKVQNVAWGRPGRGTHKLTPRRAAATRLVEPRRRVRGAHERTRVEALTTGTSVASVITGKQSVRRERDRARAAEQEAQEAARALAGQSEHPEVRSRYRDAWILIDRPGKADDNAEHLYRYLQTERPEINAWFLLERSSPDWRRLEADGFRMIEYGSDEAVLLAHNARVCLSSDATADVMYPAGRARYAPLPPEFVFLQHGITKDDLSRWLNPKRISLVIAATRAEHQGFVGRASPYRLGRAQVALTGFARYDSLHQARQQAGQAGTLLVAPTWRSGLARVLEGLPEHERTPYLLATEYWRQWSELLADPRLHELATRHDLTVKFLPHPALDSLIADAPLPAGVERIRYPEISFQRELACSAMLVTDYSSIFFDAAYVGVPVVFHQFDRDEMFSGSHNFRKGYFDYDRDGLGPIEYTTDGVIKQLEEVANGSFVLDREFQNRVDSTFAYRDNGNCARIVAAVEEMLRKERP